MRVEWWEGWGWPGWHCKCSFTQARSRRQGSLGWLMSSVWEAEREGPVGHPGAAGQDRGPKAASPCECSEPPLPSQWGSL